VLHFNTTSKLNSAAVAAFPKELVSVFGREEAKLMNELDACEKGVPSEELVQAVDTALYKHRYKFEISNPLV
jgi:hypothetical protein